MSPEKEHPVKAFGWAARDTSGHLSPFHFTRRVPGEKDVVFKVLYCGICYSDLHAVKNEWGNSSYPMVPGRSILMRKNGILRKDDSILLHEREVVGSRL